MKKLVITVPDQEFPHLLGALMKMSASFHVEHVPEQAEPEKPKPERQARTADGKSTRDVLREAFKNGAGRVHRSNLGLISKEVGFADTTLSTVAAKLVREGRLSREGDFYVMRVGQEI